jgi:hypothetical protein
MRWAGHVACRGAGKSVYRVLVGRLESKWPLGKPRRRWEDNVKLDFREMRINGANCIRLTQDRDQWRAFVNTLMDLVYVHDLYTLPNIIRVIISR